MAEPLGQDIEQFINRHIHSVEQLEILLTVGGTPDRSWSVAEIFQKIQTNEVSISECLEQFARDRLVVREGDRRYRIPDSALAQILNELQRVYRDRHVTVIETIYRNPSRQIRSFADAFKFRKDK